MNNHNPITFVLISITSTTIVSSRIPDGIVYDAGEEDEVCGGGDIMVKGACILKYKRMYSEQVYDIKQSERSVKC